MARQLMAEDEDDEDSRDDNLEEAAEAGGEKSKTEEDPTPMETESRE